MKGFYYYVVTLRRLRKRYGGKRTFALSASGSAQGLERCILLELRLDRNAMSYIQYLALKGDARDTGVTMYFILVEKHHDYTSKYLALLVQSDILHTLHTTESRHSSRQEQHASIVAQYDGHGEIIAGKYGSDTKLSLLKRQCNSHSRMQVVIIKQEH
jgi:hypothetical protein